MLYLCNSTNTIIIGISMLLLMITLWLHAKLIAIFTLCVKWINSAHLMHTNTFASTTCVDHDNMMFVGGLMCHPLSWNNYVKPNTPSQLLSCGVDMDDATQITFVSGEITWWDHLVSLCVITKSVTTNTGSTGRHVPTRLGRNLISVEKKRDDESVTQQSTVCCTDTQQTSRFQKKK